MTKQGIPDFESIVDHGGTVTGALPGGVVMDTINVDGKITVLYAAQIDKGDGSTPVFVKGIDLSDGSNETAKDRQADLRAITAAFHSLPNNLDEARRQNPDGLLTWVADHTASTTSIDLHA
jgi:hypothetical protein